MKTAIKIITAGTMILIVWVYCLMNYPLYTFIALGLLMLCIFIWVGIRGRGKKEASVNGFVGDDCVTDDRIHSYSKATDYTDWRYNFFHPFRD